MADEQTIYLSPEEELTSVRERLERTEARRIILVIPQQTQLRSHVGWRLIHARMREMGKELLVISPDRQVRAVARAAGFHVAESREATSNRPRTGTSTRSGMANTRGSTRSRTESSRSRSSESRIPQQPSGRARPLPNPSSRSLIRPPAPVQPDYEDETPPEPLYTREIEPANSQEAQPLSTTLFETPEDKFAQGHDFHISTTPSVRPSVPYVEEETLSYDDDDYRTAQDIMRAAREGSSTTGTVKDEPIFTQPERESHAPSTRSWHLDSFNFLEDDQQLAPLPEQRAAAPLPVEEVETSVPEISDRPTDVIESEVEYLGDVEATNLPEMHTGDMPMTQPTPLPEQSVRPRPRPRTGQIQPSTRRSPREPRPGMQDFSQDEDPLPPIDRPTMPPRPVRSSRTLAGSGQREPQPIITASNPRPVTRNSGSTTAQKPPSRQLLPPPGPSRQTTSAPRRPARSNRGLITVFTIVILLLLIAGFLFYLVPSATVTVSLPAKQYAQSVQLNATADSHSTLTNKIPAQMLQQTFSVSGSEKATGTTTVGNAKASGLVTFTNNGSASVIIPQKTIISTTSGIQFVTQGEALVQQASTFQAVPVQAQDSGNSGNVAPNSITSIPPGSLNTIAQFNHVSATTLKLSVDNTSGTSGGGASQVPAVSNQDRNALTQTLHQKIQQEISAWLTQQSHKGDIEGTPQPDVPASKTPVSQEKLSGAPAAGQPATSASFTGSLSVTISVLIARAASLQAGAGTQINSAAQALHPTASWASQIPITFSHLKWKQSKDGSSLAITAKANGAIIPLISTQEISGSLTGKSISQAEDEVKSEASRLADEPVSQVKISIFPSFITIMPFQAGRIEIVSQGVHPVPTPTPVPKKVPNG